MQKNQKSSFKQWPSMHVCLHELWNTQRWWQTNPFCCKKPPKPKWNSTVCAYSKRKDEKWKRNWAMLQNEISPIVTLNLIRTLMQISIKHWLEVTDFEHQSPIFANNRINPACWADGHFSWCIRRKWRDESESKQKHSLKFLQIRIRIGLNETWFIQLQWISLAVC